MEKVTNLEYLKRLAKGNEVFLRDMVRIFLEETPSEIAILGEAIRSRDYGHISAAAHKLRSTVPFVGIDKWIAGDISEIEDLARQRSATTAGQQVQSTGNDIIRTIEKLFDHIRQVCLKAFEELRTLKL